MSLELAECHLCCNFGESKSQIQPRFKGRGPQRAGVALWGPPAKDPVRLPFIHSSPATQASVLVFKHTVHTPASGLLHLFPSPRIPFTQYPQGIHSTPPFSLSLNATLVEKPYLTRSYKKQCTLPVTSVPLPDSFFLHSLLPGMGFPAGTSGKEPTCQCRKHRDKGSIPESGRSPGGGNDYPLQYSCLGNPVDRGA